jgi:hypothetical protein
MQKMQCRCAHDWPKNGLQAMAFWPGQEEHLQTLPHLQSSPADGSRLTVTTCGTMTQRGSLRCMSRGSPQVHWPVAQAEQPSWPEEGQVLHSQSLAQAQLGPAGQGGPRQRWTQQPHHSYPGMLLWSTDSISCPSQHNLRCPDASVTEAGTKRHQG